MSKRTTSRRELLTGAAGVAAGSALVAMPVRAVAYAYQTHIQRLQQKYVSLLPEIERLSREADLAFDRLAAATPPVPNELHTNFFHAHVNGLKQYVRVGHYGRGDVEWIPAEGWRHRVEQPLCPAEQGPTAEIMMVTHDRARAREVLPIAERYEAACQAVRSETGYDAANDAWEAAVERKEELQREILSASPQGLADLLVQAETVKARDYPEDDAPALIAAIQSLAGRGPLAFG